jgi:hypothetical protein
MCHFREAAVISDETRIPTEVMFTTTAKYISSAKEPTEHSNNTVACSRRPLQGKGGTIGLPLFYLSVQLYHVHPVAFRREHITPNELILCCQSRLHMKVLINMIH